MKFSRPNRIDGRVPVLSAADAVNYIPDEATLCVLGAGGGILEATTLINALAEKYKNSQSPRNLALISPTGLGDRADRGISPLAQEGLVKWALCGHWGQSPRISDLAEQNKISAYNYPQGVLTQTLRASAAHQPGILSDIGIGTFVDPRQQGGKLNEVTTEDLIKLVEIDNKEYLYYKAIAPNIARWHRYDAGAKDGEESHVASEIGAYSRLSGRYCGHRPRPNATVWWRAG